MLIDLIIKGIPIKFLPKAHRTVCDVTTGTQKNIEYDTLERRELLKNKIKQYGQQLFKKTFPLHKAVEKFNQLNQKYVMFRFHSIVGELALTHAAIEQILKNELLYQWEAPEKIIRNPGERAIDTERLYGENLTKIFLALIKSHKIPPEFYTQYKTWTKKFTKISRQRNETLKALYYFDLNLGSPIKVEMKHLYGVNRQPYTTHEDFLNLWRKKVEPKELKKLRDTLIELKQELLIINSRVFKDKIELSMFFTSTTGQRIPSSALKSPYLYKDRLLSGQVS